MGVLLPLETILALAPTPLENRRTNRYRGDDQALELRRFGQENATTVAALYAFLSELAQVLEVNIEDPAPLLAFVARHDLAELTHRLRQLVADPRDNDIAEAIHDIRGGAMTALSMQLGRLRRVPYRADLGRALSIYARDHMKMMRNVVSDLDVEGRARDLALLPHSLTDLAQAMASFTGSFGGSLNGSSPSGSLEQPIAVEVSCTATATIADSCVECSAIDRVAYNLLNNAARHVDQPHIAAWLVVLESDLRVVVANSIASSQRAVLEGLLAKGSHDLFGSFTTSGSGYGLRIVRELVGRAYGVPTLDALLTGGYVGAGVFEQGFVSWFHWPLSGA